jgi:hypothetical protein
MTARHLITTPRYHVLRLSNAYHVIRFEAQPMGRHNAWAFGAVKAFPFCPATVSASGALLAARLHAADMEAASIDDAGAGT